MAAIAIGDAVPSITAELIQNLLTEFLGTAELSEYLMQIGFAVRVARCTVDITSTEASIVKSINIVRPFRMSCRGSDHADRDHHTRQNDGYDSFIRSFHFDLP